MLVRQIVFKTVRLVGRLVYGKNVWLISDRETMAGDNGEAFFMFLQSKNVKPVFAIRKDCEDYERISRIGNVVSMNSLKYKILLCVCECHCSSHLLHMKNHTETTQFFLQHGVAYSDISKMIRGVAHKKFFIISSSQMEADQFIKGGIAEDHVLLTGLPRFDYLTDNAKKIICIAFSWRCCLKEKTDKEFLESDYFRTIERIMDDTALHDALREKGYCLYFKLHPEFLEYKRLFKEHWESHIYNESYNQLYRDVSLMVTDYSSAISDCAYLHKPVLYFYFDGDQHFKCNNYISEGIFDYEKHGFGPVVKDYDSFKSKLFEIVDNGCIMEDKFKARVDSYFKYLDKNNCERLFEKIEEQL